MPRIDSRTVRLMAVLVTAVGAVIFLYDNEFLMTSLAPTGDNGLETTDGDVAEEAGGPLAAADGPGISVRSAAVDWGAVLKRGGLAIRARAKARAAALSKESKENQMLRRFVRDLPLGYTKGNDTLLDRLISIERHIVETRMRRPNVIMRGMRWTQRRDMDTYRKALARAGLRLIADSGRAEYSGMLCIGIGDLNDECISGTDYPKLERYQRISRIQGLRRVLWRKDGFCYTVGSALAQYEGRSSMPTFSFPCWTIPKYYNALLAFDAEQRKNGTANKYIVKPTNSGAGQGIFVVSSAAMLRKIRSNLIVQPYLNNPYLVDGYKFDLRTYVLVTSVSPLRIYMYREGLVRFASSKYNSNATAGGKKTQFLTNTSINKKFKNVNELVWRFSKFKAYLKSVGEDPQEVFERIYRAVTYIFISSEARFRRHFEKLQAGYTCINCYQLLGVDVIFDEMLNPRVIEVNGSPDMGLSHQRGSAYDATKIGMMTDVLSVVYRRSSVAVNLARDLRKIGGDLKGQCTEETRFCLDDIDLEYLIDNKREFRNRGGFTRLYPMGNGAIYTDFMRHMDGLASDQLKLKDSESDEQVLPRNSRGSMRMHEVQIELERVMNPKWIGFVPPATDETTEDNPAADAVDPEASDEVDTDGDGEPELAPENESGESVEGGEGADGVDGTAAPATPEEESKDETPSEIVGGEIAVEGELTDDLVAKNGGSSGEAGAKTG